MKVLDFVEFSFANLRKRRLRTFLTAFGVTIGIGALVSMLSFGTGMQKNVTESFKAAELFNSLTVLPGGPAASPGDPDSPRRVPSLAGRSDAVLTDQVVAEIANIPGVETVYPDVNFPALAGFEGREEFRLVQVIPARIASSKRIRVAWGRSFASDDEDAVLVSRTFLKQMSVTDPSSAAGKKLRISSVAFDFGRLNAFDLSSLLAGGGLLLAREDYEFPIAGVIETPMFGGPGSFQNDVLVPPGAAKRIKRLPITSVWDLFRLQTGRLGYSALNVTLESPRDLEQVKSEVRKMGFSTFALADRFEQVTRSFIYLDMVLAAVGMIAIVVAALGIVNTMMMSILERFREIGIMKAVGADDGDIRQIFFFESASIGFMGGVFGCILGWGVSRVINRIVNYLLSRQGIPHVDYFSFPVWLFLSAVAFALLVSLVSGIYPASRAARVDPVVALRHD